jgi:hypothetical protein
MKNAVFWDVAPCKSSVNRRFGGMYRLHLQGRKIRKRGIGVRGWLQTAAIRSSKTSVYTRYTRRHIPEDGIVHSFLFSSPIDHHDFVQYRVPV